MSVEEIKELENSELAKTVLSKSKELRDLNSEELIVKLNDFKSELFSLRFQLATGQLENTARIKMVKKDIARVMTVMRERQLAKKA